MRRHRLDPGAVARTAGFVLVAVAIGAATLHFRGASHLLERSAEPQAAPDRLSGELKRCRVLAAQAKDDPACEAAWAENRRRFFTYRPYDAAAAPDAAPKSPGR